jgi:hypothetical protein
MPADFLATVPGYGPDLAKKRAAAREIMTRLGYGPDKRLSIKVAARNIPTYRDPAVILIDQLKEIWIDGELEPVETANWFPKLAWKFDTAGNCLEMPNLPIDQEALPEIKAKSYQVAECGGVVYVYMGRHPASSWLRLSVRADFSVGRKSRGRDMSRSSSVGLVARSGVFAVGYGTDYAEKFRHLPLCRRC